MTQFKISKNTIILLAIIAALIYIIFAIISHKNKKLNEINDMYKVAQDSTIFYRNSLGQQVAKTGVLESTNTKYFLELQTKDKELIELQDLVKSETKKRKDVEAAIIFKNKTIINLQDSLKNTIIGNTQDSGKVYPIYEKKISNQWLSQNIKLGLNTFEQKLTFYNSYELVIGNEPDGLFRRKQFGEIKNISPYSETTSIKIYQKQPVKNKILITGVKCSIIGFAIGFIFKSF